MESPAVRCHCTKDPDEVDPDEKSIVLFDGVCNLCNWFVNFLILRDKKNTFLFGSLQSTEVKAILKKNNHTVDNLSTVILLEKNRLYTQSTAVLKIIRKMGGLWPCLYGFIILPKFLRDPAYNLIAKNRYRLFGRRDACMIPTPELKARFL
jgi:predicted DCC family thiol-disulfide oxidoreductase YuxK